MTCWGESMWRESSPMVQGGMLGGGGMLTVVPQDDQAEAAAPIP